MRVLCVDHFPYAKLDEHGGTLLAGEAGHVHSAVLQVWGCAVHDGYLLRVADCLEVKVWCVVRWTVRWSGCGVIEVDGKVRGGGRWCSGEVWRWTVREWWRWSEVWWVE